MDTHAEVISSVCRIGGGLFSECTHSTRYRVADYSTSLKEVFNIDVKDDLEGVHPQYFCSKCERVLNRVLAGGKQVGGGCGSPVTWPTHSRTNCKVCQAYQVKSKPGPGRPPKRKAKHQRPTSTETQTHTALPTAQSQADTIPEVHSGMDISEETVLAKAMPSYTADLELQAHRYVDINIVQTCKICLKPVDRAIETPCCNDLYCGQCICQRLVDNNTCLTCNNPLKASELKSPHPRVARMLSSSTVRCDYYDEALRGCPATMKLMSLQEHVRQCPFRQGSAQAIRTVRPSSTAAEILSASPSKLRGNVAEKLVGQLVKAHTHGDRLEVKTGERGRPQVFERTTAGTVSSSIASRTTLRRREAELEQRSRTVCVDDSGVRAQDIAGLRRLSAAEQDKLLQDAGLRPSQPAAGSLLAIKADMNLPWSQVRKLKQWLRAFGVSLESERAARAFIAQSIPEYTCQELPMTKKDGSVVMANCVYFPDLVAVVMHYLELYSAADQLTWHDGVIPESEIWLKLGGDHGGGSFKFVLQVVNTKKPNSISNTIPICVFDNVDSPANLEVALGRYRDQILSLNSGTSTWQERSFRVFFFGDYEYQTKCYGLSGSSGVRPCLHCLCPKKAMDEPHDSRQPTDSEPRSLEQLSSDYTRFSEAGGVLSQAKHFHNVIRPQILPVPLENVVIPVLHLDLGIYPWMFEAFMGEIQDLDIQLASLTTPADTDSSTFVELARLHHTLVAVEADLARETEQTNQLNQQLQYVVLFMQQGGIPLEGVAQQIQQQWQLQHQRVEELTERREKLNTDITKQKSAKRFNGPCASAVEDVLQKHNIQRQAYHGGAFVGNHINSALKPEVVAALVAAPVTVVSARSESSSLRQNVTAITDRYRKLFTAYSKCRDLFSHCRSMTEEDVDSLELHISEFLQACRSEIVARNLGHVTPKLHLLESHTVPAIRRLRVGLGLLAEHGSESIHARFNSLHRNYHAIPNPLKRLEAIAKQHVVNTLPQHSAVRQATKDRK